MKRARCRPLTGARIETAASRETSRQVMVAPSRGRGSKRATLVGSARNLTSPPHGGADRNPLGAERWPYVRVAPSRGRGSKLGGGLAGVPAHEVAPSRGRGSKHQSDAHVLQFRWSPPHGGADRNGSRALDDNKAHVAPSRGRGSKPTLLPNSPACVGVAPSRGRGSKRVTKTALAADGGRPLTGARIETPWRQVSSERGRVAPSRGRGSKLVNALVLHRNIRVAPSRGRGSKHSINRWRQ